MEYTTHSLAKLSGVTTRTLRYYDQIGLLKPKEVRPSGYRVYGGEEVNRLQEIMFFRALQFPLAEIREILASESHDRETILEQQLHSVMDQRRRLDLLVGSIKSALAAERGEKDMSDKEKFEGLKEQMVRENENKYGEEARGKYGDDAVDASNRKLRNMTKEQMDAQEALRKETDRAIKTAFEAGNPQGPLAMEAARLHRDWIIGYWPDGLYSGEAHRGLADMYAADERFREYYDKLGEGCAAFVRDAIYAFTKGPGAVDSYIEGFPEPVRGKLSQIRDAIREELPFAREKISYGMPTFWQDENLIHFAGYKGHIGLYPTAEGMEAFQEELSLYKTSKGAVRIPLDQPLPLDLVRRMARHRLAARRKK